MALFNNNNYISTINNNEELDELLEKINTFDYSTFYRGIVEDNNDTKHLGRVKVRIPQLHGTGSGTNVQDSVSLPWAFPAYMPMGNDSGSYLLPNIGDVVFVTFEGNDPEHVIYFGGVLTKRGGYKSVGSKNINRDINYVTDNDDYNSEIVNGTERVIYKSLKGATIMVDDVDGNENIKIIDQSGQSIIMENTRGEMLDRRQNKVGHNPFSRISITNNRGESIELSDGKIHIKCGELIIETDKYTRIGIDTTYTDELNSVLDILGEKPEGDDSNGE